jgi:hypothetical protein
LLPPTTVEEQSPFTAETNGLNIIGWGQEASTIKFTDLTSKGFEVAPTGGTVRGLWDGFVLSGSDATNRSNGTPAIDIKSTAWGFNIGRVSFDEWADPIVHINGPLFGSRWHSLHMENNLGKGLQIDNCGPQNRIGLLDFGKNGDNPVIVQDLPGAQIQIGSVNIGSPGGTTPIQLKDTSRGHLTLGSANWEPTDNVNTASVVDLAGDGYVLVGHIHANAGSASSPSVDSIVSLAGNNANNIIMPLKSSMTVNNSKVDIASQPDGESWYFGPSGDITNSAASSTNLVRSLATAGNGNG